MLRVRQPTVVSMHRVSVADRRTRESVERERLRGALDEGAIVHAVTQELADALVTQHGIERSAIVVAHPGIRAVTPWAPAVPGALPEVAVISSVDPSMDNAVLQALQGAATVSARLVRSCGASGWACAVVPGADEGFPAAAIEAIASGIPVVTVRDTTTMSLLGGAATLVDRSVSELVEATMDLATSESARAIAIVAGRTRAEDFSWQRCAPDLIALYDLALRRF
jgi:glycosyltransferase involved in cell wall biosynthesis